MKHSGDGQTFTTLIASRGRITTMTRPAPGAAFCLPFFEFEVRGRVICREKGGYFLGHSV